MDVRTNDRMTACVSERLRKRVGRQMRFRMQRQPPREAADEKEHARADD